VWLVISICHPLLSVTCNDRRCVDYATTLTQALLQVLASYSVQRLFSNSHVLTPIPVHLIPIPIPFPSQGWSYSHSHRNPMGPMGFQSFPFPCTPLPLSNCPVCLPLKSGPARNNARCTASARPSGSIARLLLGRRLAANVGAARRSAANAASTRRHALCSFLCNLNRSVLAAVWHRTVL